MSVDGDLVLQLVREVVLQPRYRARVDSDAARLHAVLCNLDFKFKIARTRETSLYGWMETVSVVSEGILHSMGFATRWYLPSDPMCRYYPLHIQALDLSDPKHQHAPYFPRRSNPLGGFRVW